MKIIITMAGIGKRFTEHGYKVPKHEIEVNGKTLFELSMLSLSDLKNEEFIFIKRKDNRSKYSLEKLIIKAKIRNYTIVEIDFITDGQASTALLADPYINDDEKVLIYNIDTFVQPNIIKMDDFLNFDGVIHTFHGTGTKWSFAKVDSQDRVIDITEKIKISDNASIGLYYFKKWIFFKHTLIVNKEQILNTYNESYIAPIYKYLLDTHSIYIRKLNSDKVHILGTPQEVETYKKINSK
jgi:NDP-sugar pyrophosphorylase family protein